MDQRRAHVLAREIAPHYSAPFPVTILIRRLSSLRGIGRMNPAESAVEGKSSESNPTSAIPSPASRAETAERVAGAFYPAKEVAGTPVVEIVRSFMFLWEGSRTVERAEQHRRPLSFATEEEFLDRWVQGGLHPHDLKDAVVSALDRILGPARAFFAARPELAPHSLRAPTPGNPPSAAEHPTRRATKRCGSSGGRRRHERLMVRRRKRIIPGERSPHR